MSFSNHRIVITDPSDTEKIIRELGRPRRPLQASSISDDNRAGIAALKRKLERMKANDLRQ